MKKLEVENPKLKSIVAKLWVDVSEPIGDGSIADAIRHETQTGEDVGGRLHRQKVKKPSNNWKSGSEAKQNQNQMMINVLQEKLSKTLRMR